MPVMLFKEKLLSEAPACDAKNFTFVVCITATPAVMISTDESAYSLVLTVSLGIEDFVLYSIEFRL